MIKIRDSLDVSAEMCFHFILEKGNPWLVCFSCFVVNPYENNNIVVSLPLNLLSTDSLRR